jgi:hypothetical protein
MAVFKEGIKNWSRGAKTTKGNSLSNFLKYKTQLATTKMQQFIIKGCFNCFNSNRQY